MRVRAREREREREREPSQERYHQTHSPYAHRRWSIEQEPQRTWNRTYKDISLPVKVFVFFIIVNEVWCRIYFFTYFSYSEISFLICQYKYHMIKNIADHKTSGTMVQWLLQQNLEKEVLNVVL